MTLLTHTHTFPLLGNYSRPTYGGESYNIIVETGVLFACAALLRFYFLSFYVADVRMAQTVYFYGSLISMFVIWTIFMITVICAAYASIFARILARPFTLLSVFQTYTGYNGNISAAFRNPICGIMTIADPIFGWFVIIAFTHNMLGVRTQFPDQGVLGPDVAGNGPLYLGIACIIYFALLFVVEGGPMALLSPFYLCFGDDGPRPRRGAQQEVGAVNEDSILRHNSNRFNPITGDDNFDDVVISSDVSLEPIKEARVAPIRVRGLVDPDVAAERIKVNGVVSSSINTSRNAILTHNLKKVYQGQGSVPTKVAVKGNQSLTSIDVALRID